MKIKVIKLILIFIELYYLPSSSVSSVHDELDNAISNEIRYLFYI